MPLVDGPTSGNLQEVEYEDCNVSSLGRKPRKQHNALKQRTTSTLELIHTEVVGLFESYSVGGSKYFITLYDDLSAFSMVQFLQKKSEAMNSL